MNVRLGSPLPQTWDSAAGWIAAVQRHGFRAAYWPLGDDADVVRRWSQETCRLIP